MIDACRGNHFAGVTEPAAAPHRKPPCAVGCDRGFELIERGRLEVRRRQLPFGADEKRGSEKKGYRDREHDADTELEASLSMRPSSAMGVRIGDMALKRFADSLDHFAESLNSRIEAFDQDSRSMELVLEMVGTNIRPFETRVDLLETFSYLVEAEPDDLGKLLNLHPVRGYLGSKYGANFLRRVDFRECSGNPASRSVCGISDRAHR